MDAWGALEVRASSPICEYSNMRTWLCQKEFTIIAVVCSRPMLFSARQKGYYRSIWLSTGCTLCLKIFPKVSISMFSPAKRSSRSLTVLSMLTVNINSKTPLKIRVSVSVEKLPLFIYRLCPRGWTKAPAYRDTARTCILRNPCFFGKIRTSKK